MGRVGDSYHGHVCIVDTDGFILCLSKITPLHAIAPNIISTHTHDFAPSGPNTRNCCTFFASGFDRSCQVTDAALPAPARTPPLPPRRTQTVKHSLFLAYLPHVLLFLLILLLARLLDEQRQSRSICHHVPLEQVPPSSPTSSTIRATALAPRAKRQVDFLPCVKGNKAGAMKTKITKVLNFSTAKLSRDFSGSAEIRVT